jgi:hypothetical protein
MRTLRLHSVRYMQSDCQSRVHGQFNLRGRKFGEQETQRIVENGAADVL